jgi:predicted ATPase
MEERIKVNHFGPISHLNIEIKRLTVFIGSQGSGKSFVASTDKISLKSRRIINSFSSVFRTS